MIAITFTDNEAEEVLMGLRLRRVQKRTPYPGVVECAWTKVYEAICFERNRARDPLASAFTDDIRVTVQTRNRW